MKNIYTHDIQINSDFRKSIKKNYNHFIIEQSNRFSLEDCLKIDLHCHDLHSDTPDELWGRILKLPETWLKTADLVKTLESNQCSLITVTNHNNARSCWALKDAGKDVLAAAEFTCFFPEDELFVHVLTYGFTQEQEVILNKKRRNIYHFLAYTAENNLPTTLAHPLYFYSRKQQINMEYFEKFAVLFQRYEVMNGQRDYWQNLLTKEWVDSLTPELCDLYAKKHHINPADFAVNINQSKIMTGGSDDHMGIFAGECGSYLHIPDLKQRLKRTSKSNLALEALRNGQVAPYGRVYENQKLNIALMDYTAQITTRMKDPGLLRILFHRGNTMDKMACFMFSNFILELQRHGKTEMFFQFVHNALTGKKLNKFYKWRVAKDYKFSIKHLEDISCARRKGGKKFIHVTDKAIAELFTELNLLTIKRINKFINGKNSQFSINEFSTEKLAQQFEIPSHLRKIFYSDKYSSSDNMTHFNLGKILDELSFPVLVSIVLAGSMMASTRLLCQNRTFLNQFSTHIKKYPHPKRALWLSDTFFDKNGVSSVLKLTLAEIQKQDLAIDFLVCHPTEKSQDHLHVIRPLTSFSINSLGEQVFNYGDLLEIKNIFYQGGYDRIICSTEALMGPIALMLKHTFNVPCYFYMHTDWMEFIKNTTKLNQSEQDRIRRFLRFYYQQFDGIFVLNKDHKNWLSSHKMELAEEKIFLTAHWVTNSAQKNLDFDIEAFYKQVGLDFSIRQPTIFFAGRISHEKGIFDFPEIYKQVQAKIPDIRFVIAGCGPAEDKLKKQLPEAYYMGWVDKNTMDKLYLSLDLFIFPSRFDTFGNVVLEAFGYGMPVVAYNSKGPKDIIEDGKNGYLVEDKNEMAKQIIDYFTTDISHKTFKENAIHRCQSSQYQAETILAQLLKDIQLKR